MVSLEHLYITCIVVVVALIWAFNEEKKLDAQKDSTESSIIKKSELGWLPVFLLCFFLGSLGAHRFYVGKKLSGFLFLITGGFVVIGWLIDTILILFSSFTDSEGNVITPGNKSGQVVLNNKSSTIDQLREFSKLRDEGILTEEEFQAKKMELLS